MLRPQDEPSQGDVDPHAPVRLDVECARAARILRTFTLDAADLPAEVSLAERRKSQVVLRKIPPAAIAAAQGLVVLTVLRSGALDNELSGSGVVLARLKDGSAFTVRFFACLDTELFFLQTGLLLALFDYKASGQRKSRSRRRYAPFPCRCSFAEHPLVSGLRCCPGSPQL